MTGKEKVARRVVGEAILHYTEKKDCLFYLSPNWILDDIDGMKGATAERRLRELREEYLSTYFAISILHVPCGYGYRPSREHENYWEYEKEFIEFLKDYAEQKEKK